MKKIFCVFICLVFFTNAFSEDKDSKYYLESGNVKFNKGDFAGAFKDYNKSIELDLKNARAYYERGEAEYNLGKTQDAVSDYNKAIQLEPGFIVAYSNRGIAEAALGDYTDAIKDFDKKIQFNPRDYETFCSRGNAKFVLRDNSGAIKDYDKAIEFDRKYEEAYVDRGIIKSRLNDDKGAIKDFDKAIELNPKDAEAYYNRARAKDRTEDHAGAANDFENAIDFNQNQDEKITILMQLWVEKHNAAIPSKVIDYIKPLLQTEPATSDEKAFPAAKIKVEDASKYGIPDTLDEDDGLTALSRVETGGQIFLIADYEDNSEDEDDSNWGDLRVYLKIGKQYELMFNAETAQFIKIGKNSPVFLKIGSQDDNGFYTTLYSVKKDLPKDAVFDSDGTVKTLKADAYLQNELKLYTWQEGYVCFKDLDSDGFVEAINKSVARMPDEVSGLIAAKLNMNLNDVKGNYAGPWGEEISIYKWDGSKFQNLADYYEH